MILLGLVLTKPVSCSRHGPETHGVFGAELGPASIGISFTHLQCVSVILRELAIDQVREVTSGLTREG